MATRHWRLLGFICIKRLFALDKLLNEYFLERISKRSGSHKRLPKFVFQENKEWRQHLNVCLCLFCFIVFRMQEAYSQSKDQYYLL